MKGGPGLRREAQAPWAGLEVSLMDLTLGHEDVLVSAAAAGVAGWRTVYVQSLGLNPWQ